MGLLKLKVLKARGKEETWYMKGAKMPLSILLTLKSGVAVPEPFYMLRWSVYFIY